MQYMGGKAKIARRLVEAILNDGAPTDWWFEPFVGGGNVLEYAAPHFGISFGMDAHPDLILMWKSVRLGWSPPEFIDRDEYKALRGAEPSALRGYAGFGASFGGKWFGGYGVSPRDGEVCRASYRAVVRQGSVFRSGRTMFAQGEFGSFVPPVGVTVYCDPPYAGTTGYSTGAFDYTSFYSRLIEWAREECYVYVSEYQVPDWVPCAVIWEREKRNVLEKSENQRVVTEKLFRINP